MSQLRRLQLTRPHKRRIVRDALDNLGATHCQVVELRYIRDLSYNEIGTALGITSTNAGVRINRALSRLRAALSLFVDPSDGLGLPGPPISARM